MKKVRYKNIDDILNYCLKPRLAGECQRLCIPEWFVPGLYGIYHDLDCSSCCEPIRQDGKVQKVRIRIDNEIRSPAIALLHFWHEMRHAKDYYENCKPSEFRAYLYMLIRGLQELTGVLFRKNTLTKSFNLLQD